MLVPYALLLLGIAWILAALGVYLRDLAQVVSVIICILVSGVVSVIALSIVKAIMGLRVTETAEREGLDITTHGERAYN